MIFDRILNPASRRSRRRGHEQSNPREGDLKTAEHYGARWNNVELTPVTAGEAVGIS